jgi:hypothetical protein
MPTNDLVTSLEYRSEFPNDGVSLSVISITQILKSCFMSPRLLQTWVPCLEVLPVSIETSVYG